jgi:hypothetical protein
MSLCIRGDPMNLDAAVRRSFVIEWIGWPGPGPDAPGPSREDDGNERAGEGATVEIETKGLRVDLSRARWLKSSRSGSACDNCVEVAFVDDAIAVRDSKNPDGAALIFTTAEWDAFVGGAKDGEFDL